jgi:Zn-finger nucleic acid-binding protein
MPDLNCPKCLVPMRDIERNGVTIERCNECGGIFLDRGELEHLTQAENAYAVSANRRGRDDDDDDDDDDRRFMRREATRTDERGQPAAQPPRKKKRRGFLEDLLDFGGDD